MWIKQYLSLPSSMLKSGVDMFAYIMQMQGKAYRDVGIRKTIQVNIDGRSYFVKQHFGVGWREIFKNLFSFKRPILSAITEVNAIQKLVSIGIATTPLVGYGVKGKSPATLQSFIITEDLGNIISLEDLCVDWNSKPPSEKLKRRLIVEVAMIARKLHENGINHRDFYLCHLCLDADLLAKNEIKFYLIDLHRVLIHKTISTNDNMKDIAALYFSSMGIGLTKRDLLRFKMHYLPKSVLGNNFWQAVENRASKLYKKFHSDKFQKRLAAEKSAIS
ncbi:MAG: lipopolysaccharide core heptose(I) kinase RfaP [Methylotenera sp.]|uniref:lipopolysaccharide core heptose(I) kinase RfaP n=1 Tax=Methylotenera sp. TaxID=2051956 RepID=UPI0024878F2A|nr:lipopolysaccharide core heptose(I) kinase RfaP [Methylotenera sp.]MDI1308262.1 lipopolysaccharide core heptose(I) kinase RfaP [Methylotenera sp.]